MERKHVSFPEGELESVRIIGNDQDADDATHNDVENKTTSQKKNMPISHINQQPRQPFFTTKDGYTQNQADNILFSTTYLKISPIEPDPGTTTSFMVETVKATDHTMMQTIMYTCLPGEVSNETQTIPLINKILHDIHHPTEDVIYSLVCVAKDNTSTSTANGVDMVFALVGDKKNNVTGNYSLRCLLHARQSKGGDRYIDIVKLPGAFCKKEYMTSYVSKSPQNTWPALLSLLHIAFTNTRKSSQQCEKDLNVYRKANAKQGASYCVTPSTAKSLQEQVAMGVNGPTNDLTIQYTRATEIYNVNVDACTVDLHCTTIKAIHRAIISEEMDMPMPTYTIPTKDKNLVLRICIPHAARMKCSLTDKSLRGAMSYIASTDVNFCNNMVYTDMRAKNVEDVYGLQRIALRIANRLQENLTPAVIALRLGKKYSNFKTLFDLMSSVDLMADLHKVVNYHTIEDFNARTDALKLKTRLYAGINDMSQATSTQLMTVQEQVFAKCSAFKDTRVTASISAERARWQDHHPIIAARDDLLRQKMTSARGVATLSIVNQMNNARPHNNYISFSALNILSLRCHEDKSIVRPRTYTLSRSLTWTDATALKDTQFSYAYCKFTKALQFLQGEKIIATFDAHPQKSDKTSTEGDIFHLSSVPIGSLVRELLDISVHAKSVYTRALAHRVLICATENLTKTTKKVNSRSYVTPWLNYYRNQFLKEIQSAKVLNNSDLNDLYVDYSIFGQCLKDQAMGSKIPADMFALLVQQGIPFPNT